MIDDLFACMRYERDWWRLQIYHEALAPIAFISHESKQVVIQFLIDIHSIKHRSICASSVGQSWTKIYISKIIDIFQSFPCKLGLYLRVILYFICFVVSYIAKHIMYCLSNFTKRKYRNKAWILLKHICSRKSCNDNAMSLDWSKSTLSFEQPTYALWY